MAGRCAEWADRRHEPLIPLGRDQTLRSFYAAYYRPVCLADVSPTTISKYETVLRFWTLLAGDPPLEKITRHTPASFRDALIGREGTSDSRSRQTP